MNKKNPPQDFKYQGFSLVFYSPKKPETKLQVFWFAGLSASQFFSKKSFLRKRKSYAALAEE
jgi:hypothetical protein